MIRLLGMIDTINSREQAILYEYLFRNGQARSSEIHQSLEAEGISMSLVTLKRLLSRLSGEGALLVSGKGPSTNYTLTSVGRLEAQVDAHAYGNVEPDDRYGYTSYQPTLFSSLTNDIFTPSEKAELDAYTSAYRERAKSLSETLHRKELERFVVELSWKSSRIEGNTYTLLDTERLLLEGIEAPGHTKDETIMVQNHKEAFTFIHEHAGQFAKTTRKLIEDVHSLLVKDLSIASGIRSGVTGVTGSRYRPLDNKFQIEEAMNELLAAIERMPHGYAKALVALLGISYIQPFEDGNKRTARLIANAILLGHELSPLSYRSVNEEEYREATLAFYELNTLAPFKRIFINQYAFAAQTYAVS